MELIRHNEDKEAQGNVPSYVVIKYLSQKECPYLDQDGCVLAYSTTREDISTRNKEKVSEDEEAGGWQR